MVISFRYYDNKGIKNKLEKFFRVRRKKWRKNLQSFGKEGSRDVGERTQGVYN